MGIFRWSQLRRWVKNPKLVEDYKNPETIVAQVLELSLREHSKREDLPSKTILNVWKLTAWELYLHRKNNEKLLKEDLLSIVRDSFANINAEDVLATFDTLFEWKADCLTGTFHEQFMEYLVADLLINACYKEQEPYPKFLEIVLRAEINRYFRGIWEELNKKKKEKIFNAIAKQYFDNLGKTGDDKILTRVHAIYHMCRLNSLTREECIDRAFETEKNISVLLSLYFGAIKLGKLDKEEDFYQLLNKEEYSKANRGYHLTYYADIIQNGALPYMDDRCSDWQGTLKAIRRHFNSGELEHFFLWRIDLFTIKGLIEERKKVSPLTKEIIEEISDKVSSRTFNGYDEFYKKIEQEMSSLNMTFEKFSKED